MPRRNPIINSNIYHVYNRSIDGRIIFNNEIEFNHAKRCVDYYLNTKPVPKFSIFLELTPAVQLEILNKLKRDNRKLADLLAFCLMPDHFHFLLFQKESNGISKFTANFQNSYTRYFNTKYNRLGPILIPRFKAVRIES